MPTEVDFTERVALGMRLNRFMHVLGDPNPTPTPKSKPNPSPKPNPHPNQARPGRRPRAAPTLLAAVGLHA